MANELKVIMSLIDNMSKPLAGIETNFKQFGMKIDGVLKTIRMVSGALAGLFAVDKIRSAIQAGIDWGDSIEVGAKKVGMSTAAYQQNNFIAKELGTSVDSISRGMRGLALTADVNAKGFQKFGIQTRDLHGQMLPMNDLFWNTVTRLSQIGNETERTAATQKLFGKSAGEVLAIVNSGKVEIDDAREAYKDLGLELNDRTIKKLHEAKIATMEADTEFKVIGANLTAKLAPVIKNLAQDWADLLTKMHVIKDDELADKMNDNTEKLAKAKERLDRVMGGQSSHPLAYAFSMDPQKQLAKDLKEAQQQYYTLLGYHDLYLGMKKKQDAEEAAGPGTGPGGAGPDLSTGDGGASLLLSAQEKLWDNIAKNNSDSWMAQEVALKVHFSHEEQEWRTAGADLTMLHQIQQQEYSNVLDEWYSSQEKKQEAWAQKALRIEEQAIQEQIKEIDLAIKQEEAKLESAKEETSVLEYERGPNVSPWEKRAQEAKDYYLKMRELAIKNHMDLQDLDKAKAEWDKKLKYEKIADEAEMYGRTASLALDFMSKTAEATKADAGVKKAIAMGMAAVNTAEGATKALASEPPPFNFIDMGLVIAAGVAQEAIIAQQKFAGGGIVGGNSYSGDHMPVLANSGEMFINQRQQAQLFSMANGGSATSNTGHHLHFYIQEGGSIARQIDIESRRGGEMDRVVKRLLEKHGVV